MAQRNARLFHFSAVIVITIRMVGLINLLKLQPFPGGLMTCLQKRSRRTRFMLPNFHFILRPARIRGGEKRKKSESTFCSWEVVFIQISWSQVRHFWSCWFAGYGASIIQTQFLLLSVWKIRHLLQHGATLERSFRKGLGWKISFMVSRLAAVDKEKNKLVGNTKLAWKRLVGGWVKHSHSFMENFFTRFFTFFGRFHNPFPKSSTHFSLFVAFSVNIASPKCGGWKGKRSFGLLSVERVRNWKAGSNHKGFISFLLPYLLRGVVFFFL